MNFPFPRPPAALAFVAVIILAWDAPLRGAETPVVAAVPVARGDIFREVSFDAELRPYQEIEGAQRGHDANREGSVRS